MSKSSLALRRGQAATIAFVSVVVLFLTCGAAPEAYGDPGFRAVSPGGIDEFGDSKAREIVLTDLGNEPDGQMSLVRHLLYTNEIDIEGIIGTASWMKWSIDDKTFSGARTVFDAYDKVHANLLLRDPGYPPVGCFRSIFSLGQNPLGMAGVGADAPVGEGARAILAAADRDDPRPLWITIAEGGNTLAQALFHARATRTDGEMA